VGKSRLRILYDKRLLFIEMKRFDFVNHFGETEENVALDFTVLNPGKDCKVELIFQFE
jgi:hypothetical protein